MSAFRKPGRGVGGAASGSGAGRGWPGGTALLGLLGSALLVTAACAAAGGPSEGKEADVSPSTGPVETEALFQEQHTGFEEARREVVRDADAWRDVWATAYEGRTPVPAVPEVDFSRESVVLAAMGRRATGGHEVSIPEVRRTEAGLAVTVREVSPGEGCIVTQALTAPAVAVRVPVAGPAADAAFRVEEESRDCE